MNIKDTNKNLLLPPPQKKKKVMKKINSWISPVQKKNFDTCHLASLNQFKLRSFEDLNQKDRFNRNFSAMTFCEPDIWYADNFYTFRH